MKGIAFSLLLTIFGQLAVARDVKEWTVLVFISGHDKILDPYGKSDIKEMEQVGSTKDINVVVQRGTLSGDETLRYYIEKAKPESVGISSPVLEHFPRVDMADYKELIKFIEWGVKNYPAKKYFIDIWNHGSGWRKLELRSRPKKIRDIAYDEISGNLITTEQMGFVMKEFSNLIGRKVELYGSDACLMSMFEVAAGMSDYVKYFVGSQEDEPLDGWPYHYFLRKLAANPMANGDAAGVMLADSYNRFYEEQGNNLGTTFAAIDLSYLDQMMNHISDFKDSLKTLSRADLEKVYYYAVSTERFSLSDYKDFFHFFDKVKADKSLGIDAAVINNIETIRNKLIVYNVNSDVHPKAYGLSIWLPTYSPQYEKNKKRYEGMAFQQKTDWLEIVDTLIQFEPGLLRE